MLPRSYLEHLNTVQEVFCYTHIIIQFTLFRNEALSNIQRIPLKNILTNHRNRVIDVNESCRIYIVCNDFWKTAFATFKRFSFDVAKHIKVIFVGEPCEDFGGPLLEMFTMMMHHIPLCGLFEGRDGHFIPVHNTSRLNSGEYYIDDSHSTSPW